jgi:hypothetical protein
MLLYADLCVPPNRRLFVKVSSYLPLAIELVDVRLERNGKRGPYTFIDRMFEFLSRNAFIILILALVGVLPTWVTAGAGGMHRAEASGSSLSS